VPRTLPFAARASTSTMPSAAIQRRVLKPALFLLCLVPLAEIVWRAFGVAGSSLGANPIEAIQDWFGQWGLRLLIVTLAISPLRLWLGAPWLIHLRRMLGLFAFFYVLLHFTTWLVLDKSLSLTAITADLWRPFIVVGLVAFTLLIPLALTSNDAMMRRLGGRWKKLHRLSYVVPALGVWHYWWQVKADVRDPLIYAAVLAVLLLWRAWRSLRRRSARRQAPPLRDTSALSS
jgi:sulfoxide reductase heme-binding subunit YedZ